jgi:DNA polymerase-3 subunit beta
MKFSIQREELLKPLQDVCGVVERRQTLPILSHVLIRLDGKNLSLTATDLEVEMVAHTALETADAGEVTLPARKLLDICKALPEGSKLNFSIEQDKATLKAGRSRFTLATLPAGDFPGVESIKDALAFSLTQKQLKNLIEHTAFAMAQQDVRYFLNGMLLELTEASVRAVATDGHRLAMSDTKADISVQEPRQAIVPRKGIMELSRLLEDNTDAASIQLGSNHIQIELPDLSFTSKLIDGKFPDYQRVIPEGGDKIVLADSGQLLQALTRASILSNEKYRGVRLIVTENNLQVLANNPEQEEAEEELEVNYQGEAVEIGFNVSYLMDAIHAITTEKVKMILTDPNSSALIQAEGDDSCRYVVMPMRL